MSNCPLCNPEAGSTSVKSKLGDGRRPIGFLQRVWRGIQLLIPATVLVLIPKCPICVAAYVALFTGVGISVSTARWIQVLMLVVCLGSLGYLVVSYWRRRRVSSPVRPINPAVGH
jgi:hypothetical protein